MHVEGACWRPAMLAPARLELPAALWGHCVLVMDNLQKGMGGILQNWAADFILGPQISGWWALKSAATSVIDARKGAHSTLGGELRLRDQAWWVDRLGGRGDG